MQAWINKQTLNWCDDDDDDDDDDTLPNTNLILLDQVFCRY